MVVGTGRSGTHHLSTVLNDVGIEVGHEKLGDDGISSWCLVSPLKNSPYGPALTELNAEEYVVGHQLRNPINTVPSLMTINKKSWDFIRKDAKERTAPWWWRRAPIRVKAMWHWLDWNLRAEEMAEVHWTLDQAPEIGSSLAEAMKEPQLEEIWKEAWNSFESPQNNAKVRVTSFSRMIKTSPPVAIRRIRHAMKWIPATEEALFEADPILAKDMIDFWCEFKERTAQIHSN
jgi:hypothetical protein